MERKKLQIERIKMSIRENEFKVLERMEEIERIQQGFESQRENIKELEAELKAAKSED